MRRTLAVVALILTACGGGGGGGGGDKAPTVAALAGKLGCARLVIETDNSQRELGAREEGECDLAGEKVTVLAYNTNSARDAANQIARQFGGIAVLGDRWTVRVDSDAMAQRVQKALGGTLA